MKILLIGLSLLSLSVAAPSPPPQPITSYDQRQDGELNVKVDLDNFVIVVARPSSSGFDLLNSMASILAADNKSNRAPIHAEVDSKLDDEDEDNDSKSKNLDDVSLDKEPAKKKTTSEEAVIVLVQSEGAESKSDETTKNVGDIARTLRNLKIKDAASNHGEKGKSWLSSKYKFVDMVDEPQSLKLIGEAIEECGPGRSRDRLGICKQD